MSNRADILAAAKTALEAISGAGSVLRGYYTAEDIPERPGLFYFAAFQEVKPATNRSAEAKLRLGVGAWVDAPGGDHNAVDALFEAVMEAMQDTDSMPEWWSRTRPGDQLFFDAGVEVAELAGFLIEFEITYSFVRTAP